MNKNEKRSALISLTSAILLFGTIGVFREFTPLPSGLLAASRGLIGAFFLACVMAVRKTGLSKTAIKKNGFWLGLSGAMIGVNWILLFEAYRFTTVPIATLCYYMAPIFVILASPIVLKERLTAAKLVCAAVSFIGIVLVAFGSDTGVTTGDKNHPLGILLGLGAAALYAGDILINKVIDGITAEERTLSQLAVAGLVCVPYTLLAESLGDVKFTALSTVMLIIMGVLHTGIAYTLYFGSMKKLPAQTVAIISYVDPAVSVILAVLLIKGSQLSPFGWIGAVLIIGAALVSELPHKKH